MNKIIIRQLGNGGAFDYNQTNTAFTLFDDRILVDCGYNVFQKLMTTKDANGEILANKIKYIFITHEHDDHIGSLMTYLYWIEFVRKTPVTVYLPDNVFEYVNKFIKKGVYKYPSGKINFKYVKIEDLCDWFSLVINDRRISVIPITRQTHGSFYNTVYVFTDDSLKVRIVITGDTKAYKEIEEVSLEDYKGRLIVFHDYSNFNSLDNMHATKLDIDNIYSSKFKEYITPVHTGNENYKEIYTINDLKEV